MTKVKVPRPGANNHNKLSRIFLATIASIILLIVIKVLTRDKPEQVTKKTRTQPKAAVVTKETPPAPAANMFKALQDKGLSQQEITKIYLKQSGFNIQRYRERQAQHKMLEDFKTKIHLDLPFPPALDYLDLDLDDRVAGVIGSSVDGKKTFAVLATDQKVSPEAAIAYLKDSSDSFNFVRNHEFDTEKKISFPSPETSGLKPLTIIPSTDHKGLGLYVALAERKDEKGSYLFMMEAPKKEFDENDDGLQMMLNMVKVRP